MVRPSAVSVKPNHMRLGHARCVTILAVLLAAGATLMSLGGSAAAERGMDAHSARTLNGAATAHLHLVRAEGSQLTEQGPVSGALVGSMHADLRTGAVFTASFTLHTHVGTINGHGTATPHGTGRYQSFAGSFTATGGSGRYAHISGHAGLYGVLDRRTDAVIVQTTGTLRY